ncbi:hypothetical protein MXD62_19370 [Frankia sp. Mgl5]|uniref:hypothetical protein n=1 Tax=Frankia sp. Mgl5 TaxID=2933793 RepID=UPI00200E5EBE|nr:hypothetical protein [Frankia sp. Mgl5]MCK9929312.1 hypothetical protein [Frankia sp. Mgl5]
MTGRWDELGPGGHPSRAIDRDAWAPELARAAARRLEADALAAELAERARAVRFWVGLALGLAVSGGLLLWSLRTGG